MNRELHWYDVEKKQMLKFVGERLEFKYAMDYSLPKPKYRLLPVAVTSSPRPVVARKKVRAAAKITITIESPESASHVRKWFKKYQLRNPTDAEVDVTYRKTVDFEVPMEEAEDFVRDAVKNGLQFEV